MLHDDDGKVVDGNVPKYLLQLPRIVHRRGTASEDYLHAGGGWYPEIHPAGMTHSCRGIHRGNCGIPDESGSSRLPRVCRVDRDREKQRVTLLGRYLIL